MSSLSDLSISLARVGLTNVGSVGHPDDAVSVQAGHLLYFVGSLRIEEVFRNDVNLVGVLNVPKKTWRWVALRSAARFRTKCACVYNDIMYLVENKKDHVSRVVSVYGFDLIEEEFSERNTKGESPGILCRISGEYLETQQTLVVFGGKTIVPSGKLVVHLLIFPELRWVEPKVKGSPPRSLKKTLSCVRQGVIYYFGGYPNRREHDGLFMLTVRKNATVTWSDIRTNGTIFTQWRPCGFVALNGKVLLLGGAGLGEDRQCHVYDHEVKERKMVLMERRHRLNNIVRTFSLGVSNAVGLFGGNGKFDSYLRLSLSPE